MNIFKNACKLVYCTAIILAFSVLNPAITIATTFDYGNQHLLPFYIPDGKRQLNSCGSGIPLLAGANNTEKVLNYFRGKNLSMEQASGIIGNLHVESGLNPAEEQGTQADVGFNPTIATGYGLAQWTFLDRKVNLERFAGATKRPISDLTMQLDYIWFELTGDFTTAGGLTIDLSKQYLSSGAEAVDLPGSFIDYTGESVVLEGVFNGGSAKNALTDLLKQTEVREATISFKDIYEGPSIPHTELRVSKALEVFVEYGGSSSSISRGSIGCGNYTGLTETVVAYAWPEYRGPSKSVRALTAKPEYAAAVASNSANGVYVGGINYKGTDCGGFITIAMRDSGFDPNYNSYNGNTYWQLKYLLEPENGWIQVTVNDSSDVKAGDVYMATNTELGHKYGHTFMYSGDLASYGFTEEFASASLDSRVPMASKQTFVPTNGYANGNNYRVFRKVN